MTLTIKQLHEATGRLVRKAALSRTPTVISDRGRPVALLVAPDQIPPLPPPPNPAGLRRAYGHGAQGFAA